MEGLAKLFDDVLKEKKKEIEKENNNAGAEALNMIHVASKARAYVVADKVQEIEEPSISSETHPPEEPIPTQKVWNFAMGELVKVKYDLVRFKSIQKRTIGWGRRHRELIGKTGCITSTCNEYDTHLQVYFQDPGIFAELYAGVVEKVEQDPVFSSRCRFKPGDLVSIQASPETTNVLQRGYEELPIRFIKTTGKVICVGPNGVHVSFTGTFTVRVNPALLAKSEDPIKVDSFPNSKGFIPGCTARVTNNLKDLIEGQKEIGEWETDMSNLAGTEVIVLLIKPEDVVRVCRKNGKSFNMPSKLLAPLTEETAPCDVEGVPFTPGVWVRLRKIEQVRAVLTSKNLPLSILELIEFPAIVSIYDKNLRPGISYDSQYRIMVHPSILEKSSDDDATNAQRAKEGVKTLSKGDLVCLDIGPPNYVRDILRERGTDEDVIKLLTTSSTLVGFEADSRAVIQTCEGRFYKVHRKYLTLPSRYHVQNEGAERFGWEHAIDILNNLEKSLDKLHSDCSDLGLTREINPVSLVNGDPPILKVRVLSAIASFSDIYDALSDITGWEMESPCEDVIIIREIPTFKSKIKVELQLDTEREVVQSTDQTADALKADAKADKAQSKYVAREEPQFQVAALATSEKQRAVPSPQAEPLSPEGDRQVACSCHQFQWMNLKLGNEYVRVPYLPEPAQRQGPMEEGGTPRSTNGQMSQVIVSGIINDVRIP